MLQSAGGGGSRDLLLAKFYSFTLCFPRARFDHSSAFWRAVDFVRLGLSQARWPKSFSNSFLPALYLA